MTKYPKKSKNPIGIFDRIYRISRMQIAFLSAVFHSEHSVHFVSHRIQLRSAADRMTWGKWMMWSAIQMRALATSKFHVTAFFVEQAGDVFDCFRCKTVSG